MTPADQEFTHAPEAGQYGDCQRAVIASLLDLPISAVPHFLQEAQGDPSIYWEKLQAFVRSHGFAYFTVPARTGGAFYGYEGDVYHEISGPSPRGNGVSHAVVGRNGEVVFDPHPSRAGLSGDSASWEYAFLVRVAQASEPLVRYCPGCGSVGPVVAEYLDCCPDGNEARMIPETLARKCRDVFRIAIDSTLAVQAMEPRP
jgi:hypothetical protein